MPTWLREIDHTGDVGIIVTAPTLTTLFERAAQGMFFILTDLELVQPRQNRTIELAAPDTPTLLVRWLSELNYINQSERFLFCSFDVELIHEGVLRATVSGERIHSSRHQLHTEIKAVTYHGLEVGSGPDGFEARVIFDV